MYILQMHLQCANRFFEILPEEVESAELMVESIVSRVLLDLFDKVAVDEVAISFAPGARLEQHHCSIDISVHCLCFASIALTEGSLKQALELSLCPLLSELFGVVTIDNLLFSPSPWDYEFDPILSQSA